MAPTLDSRFLSVAETANRLGISTRHAYTLVSDGEIPAIRFRNRIRVPACALEEWLRDREREALEAVRSSPEMREPGSGRAQGSRGDTAHEAYTRRAP